MNNRTKLLTAAGSALLLSGIGGALALWSDAITGDAVSAATGHLDLTFDQEDATYWDVSTLQLPSTEAVAAVEESGTEGEPGYIAPVAGIPAGTLHWGITDGTPTNITTKWADFKLVPGDVIRFVYPVESDLVGNNIAAKLVVTNTADESDAALAPGGSYTFGIPQTTDTASLGGQFKVTLKGVYESFEDGEMDDALTAADGVYYFVASDTAYTDYVVFELEFIDFDRGIITNADGVTGLNDFDGTEAIKNGDTGSDLMNYDLGDVISGLVFNLVQVRS